MGGHVFYEWDVETVATVETEMHGVGGVIDHDHYDTYAEAIRLANSRPADGEEYKVVLVRDDANGRSWAYVEGGRLPEQFEDTYGRNVATVPQRFAREVERAA